MNTKAKGKNAILIISLIFNISFIGLSSFLGLNLYQNNNKLQDLTIELDKRTQSLKHVEKLHYNCEYGGSDDTWFEKNAKTRTGQPQELLRLADEIGLKHIRKVNVAYVDKRSDEAIGLYHQGLGAYGDNTKDGRTIYVDKTLNIESLKVTLAHEYLHYIWLNSATLQADQTLEDRLVSMYGRNHQLRDRVSIYAERNMLNLTELFSITCTEFSDRHMDQYILKQCNKWINRSKLRFIY